MTRKPLTKSMDPITSAIIMAEGYAISLKILNVMAEADPIFLLHIDDMNMRGQQVHMALQYCEGEFERFRIAVATRDQGMVDYVNRELPFMPRCVQRGGAPR